MGDGEEVFRVVSAELCRECIMLSERCRHISVYDVRPLAGFKIREGIRHFGKHFMFMFSCYFSLTYAEQEQMKGFKARLFIMD